MLWLLASEEKTCETVAFRVPSNPYNLEASAHLETLSDRPLWSFPSLTMQKGFEWAFCLKIWSATDFSVFWFSEHEGLLFLNTSSGQIYHFVCAWAPSGVLMLLVVLFDQLYQDVVVWPQLKRFWIITECQNGFWRREEDCGASWRLCRHQKVSVLVLCLFLLVAHSNVFCCRSSLSLVIFASVLSHQCQGKISAVSDVITTNICLFF